MRAKAFMYVRSLLLLVLLSAMVGCGDPPLHPVAGKVTLDGKPYERLIVYFRPASKKPSEFNIGVGETTASGELTLRSTAGDGLEVGKYRVSFSCVVQVGKQASAGLSDEKNDDDRRLRTKELVPEPYSTQESPVEFDVVSGSNEFNFDIPGK